MHGSPTTALHEVFSLPVTGSDLVVVDVTEAEFIGASMLGALVDLNRNVRNRGGQFRLQLGTAQIVRRVLELTGLFVEDLVLQVEQDTLAAGSLRHVNRPQRVDLVIFKPSDKMVELFGGSC